MIESIQSIESLQGLKSIATDNLKTTQSNDTLFTNSLEAAKKLLEATNEAEAMTTQLTYDFMTGANDNIHSLLIAQEKASILLQFTMQVRNKVLEAYQEIMRISV